MVGRVFMIITLIVLFIWPYKVRSLDAVLPDKDSRGGEITGKALQYGSYGGQGYRGVNISARVITEEDIKAFSEMKGNLVRVAFATEPLLKTEAPYDMNEEAFKKLDDILLWCGKYNVKAVIDPHIYPGFKENVEKKDAEFWKDYQWHQYVIRLWETIAKRYGSRGSVIAGYDLFNEPYIPNGGKPGTPAD